MEEIGKYKVSDLVKESGLPRTTINDWLQRYAPYLTYSVMGKRRLYSERTLNIIREIAALRDAGKSSLEIDQELSQHHPVRPEVASPEGFVDEEDEDEREVETGATAIPNAVGAPSPDNEAGSALVSRRQSEEIARLLSGQLQTIAARLEALEKQGPSSRDKFIRIVAAVLVLVLIGGGWLAFQEIRRLGVESAARATELRQRDEALRQRDDELHRRDQQLENITVNLDRNRKDYQANLEKLQREMGRQQELFRDQLVRMSADAGRTREAVLMQIKEQITAERLSLLRQLQNSDLSREQRAELMSRLDQLGPKMNAALEKLEKEAAVPSTSASAPGTNLSSTSEKAPAANP